MSLRPNYMTDSVAEVATYERDQERLADAELTEDPIPRVAPRFVCYPDDEVSLGEFRKAREIVQFIGDFTAWHKDQYERRRKK